MLDYNKLFGTKKKDEKKTNTFSDAFGIGGSKVEKLPGSPKPPEVKPLPLTAEDKNNTKVTPLEGTVSGSSVVAPKVNTNESWSTDVNYFDPNMDFSMMMNNLMGQGADADVIRRLQTLRRNKAMSDPSLYQYYQDGTDVAAENFIKARSLYENKRQKDIDAMFDRINGRESFDYDPENDKLYQSLKSQALKKGQRAMEDTLSRATQNAGGNNSYAIAAAQGAYNEYLSGVDDLIPQLEQLAYGKYQDKVNEDYNMLNLQMALENQDYSRWNDAQTRDLQTQQLNQENFRYMQQWAYQLAQDEYTKAQSEIDFDLKLAAYGITPSGDRQKDIQALAEMIRLETLASKKVSMVKGGEVVVEDGDEDDDVWNDSKEEKKTDADVAEIKYPSFPFPKEEKKAYHPYYGEMSEKEAMEHILNDELVPGENEDGSVELKYKVPYLDLYL